MKNFLTKRFWNEDADWRLTKPKPSVSAPAVPTRATCMNVPLRDLVYRLGGCHRVAKALGLHASSVSRWTAPHPDGCDGRPLIARLVELFAHAKRQGVDTDHKAILRSTGLDV